MIDIDAFRASAAASNARAHAAGWFETNWDTMDRANITKLRTIGRIEPLPRRGQVVTKKQAAILRAICDGASSTAEIANAVCDTVGPTSARCTWMAKIGLISIETQVSRRRNLHRRHSITDQGRIELERVTK